SAPPSEPRLDSTRERFPRGGRPGSEPGQCAASAPRKGVGGRAVSYGDPTGRARQNGIPAPLAYGLSRRARKTNRAPGLWHFSRLSDFGLVTPKSPRNPPLKGASANPLTLAPLRPTGNANCLSG